MMSVPNRPVKPPYLWNILRIVFILAVGFFLIAPLMLMIAVAFTAPTEVFGNNGELIGNVRQFSTGNFSKALDRVDGLTGIVFSAGIGFLVSLIVASFGLLIATQICQFHEPKRTVFATSLLTVKTIPALALCAPLLVASKFLGGMGLLPFIVIMVLLLIPLYVWLIFPAIRSFIDEWKDLLGLFGVRPFKAVMLFGLPMSFAFILLATLAMAVLTWNEGFFASVLGINTVVTTIPSLLSHRGTDWGAVMALGLISTIPAIILVGLGIHLGWFGKRNA